MKAAFNNLFIISYDLYLGTIIYFQQVCDIGNFFVFPPEFSNVTVILEVWSKSILDEPVANFKKPYNTYELA